MVSLPGSARLPTATRPRREPWPEERTQRVRHHLRSVVVIGTSALLLGSGAGTAAAQGSLQFTLPFPISIPGLTAPASPADEPGAGDPAAELLPADPAPAELLPTELAPAELLPADLVDRAFEGRIVAAVNEARTAVGADRLVTDRELEAVAGTRAAELAAGDPSTGEVPVPGDAVPAATATDRNVLALPEGSTPQQVLVALLGDTGMRERMLDGEFTRIGVGTATGEDGRIHVVQEFYRG